MDYRIGQSESLVRKNQNAEIAERAEKLILSERIASRKKLNAEIAKRAEIPILSAVSACSAFQLHRPIARLRNPIRQTARTGR